MAGHIAEDSVRPVDGGWTWKADPRVFGLSPTLAVLLPRLRPDIPLAFLRSAYGVVDEPMLAALAEARPQPVQLIELPDTGHHPMLDQPLVLTTALRDMLAGLATGPLPDGCSPR